MRKVILFFVCASLLFTTAAVQAAPEEPGGPDTRCAVCGMFVSKYLGWVAQVQISGKSPFFFDGVKDMLVFYNNPQKFGISPSDEIREVWVKDYYSQKWIDGVKAYYVIGSDVYGPMGKEFIPFAEKAAAENFMADHKGKKILMFNEITDDLVQSMRSGMKMRHGADK